MMDHLGMHLKDNFTYVQRQIPTVKYITVNIFNSTKVIEFCIVGKMKKLS
jgi:hypothetical protein